MRSALALVAVKWPPVSLVQSLCQQSELRSGGTARVTHVVSKYGYTVNLADRAGRPSDAIQTTSSS